MIKIKNKKVKKWINRKINKYKTYSVKEALAYYIYTIKVTQKLEYNTLIKNLENIMLNIRNNNYVVEKINSIYIEEINNFWIMTHNQMLSYGKKVFEDLIITEKELTEENIFREFILLMRLYSPDNIEKFYKN